MTLWINRLQSRTCLLLTVLMVTCLVLLINLSFKIIVYHNMLFTAGSVLCSLTSCLYFLLLRECSIIQQRHVLNQALISLYLFSIGIYLMVNLPPAAYMRDSQAYQIVFEDIPRKFFAATLSFALSFYIPHLLCSTRKSKMLHSARESLILAMFAGFSFYTIDFLLLFADPRAENFATIYFDSLMLAAFIILSAGIFYLSIFHLRMQYPRKKVKNSVLPEEKALFYEMTHYHYAVSFAVAVTLICLSCEYRLVSFANDWTMAASGILFPLTILASNLVAELYGYKANLVLAFFIILAELVFDLILIVGVLLPSPDFFDLTPFYEFIVPHRILATIITLFISLAGNSFLLEKLKLTGYGDNRGLRILVANIIVNTLLCLINYSLLFTGMYPFEQVFNLAINAWVFKFVVTLVGLPCVLWLYNLLKSTQETEKGQYLSNV